MKDKGNLIMSQQHQHKDNILIWVDNQESAIFQEQQNDLSWERVRFPEWHQSTDYRLDPICDYCISELSKLGGPECVDLYLYWVDGGVLERALGQGRGFEEFKPYTEISKPFEYYFSFKGYYQKKENK